MRGNPTIAAWAQPLLEFACMAQKLVGSMSAIAEVICIETICCVSSQLTTFLEARLVEAAVEATASPSRWAGAIDQWKSGRL